jgi:hypothetical protein
MSHGFVFRGFGSIIVLLADLYEIHHFPGGKIASDVNS